MGDNIPIHAFKWTEHGADINEERQYLFDNNVACDCFLISSDGERIGAHQLILSTVSDFLCQILTEQPAHIEPIIHIPDADVHVLGALLTFVYKGETSIASDKFYTLLELGNILHIKGFPKDGTDLDDTRGSISFTEDIVPLYLEAANTDDSDSDLLYGEPGGDTEYDIEYLDEDDPIALKDDRIQHDCSDSADELDATEEFTVEVSEQTDDEILDTVSSNTTVKRKPHSNVRPTPRPTPPRPTLTHAVARSNSSRIDQALDEVNKSGKTLSRLSIEYNVPRSTLYHRFRNNESLRQNYRVDRKSSLEQAVRVVLDENLSLMKASERFKVSKTAIWRAVRKYEQYNPSASKDISLERQQAQEEIVAGKSLKSLSTKYGIPLTTLHRDKKKLSKEGKLPETLRVRDRSEKSEFNQRLEMALEKCRQGMSQYQAANVFKIPKATMWRYAHALMRSDEKTKDDTSKSDETNGKIERSRTELN